jgi:hypothetical protein
MPDPKIGELQRKRLINLANGGSQGFDGAAGEIERTRLQALQHMQAPTAQAGGVNDISGLASRRQASVSQGKQAQGTMFGALVDNERDYIDSGGPLYQARQQALDHELKMDRAAEQAKLDRDRSISILAAAPELNRRAQMVESDIQGIGGGQSPEAIRYHQQQMADARRRQAQIDAERASGPQAARYVEDEQAALDRDIAGIGGGGLSPGAIDYQARQLDSGEQRRAALPHDEASRMKAMEAILGEVGGSPLLPYEVNSSLISGLAGPSAKDQAAELRAQLYLQDPYGVERPQKPAASDARLAALANLDLSDDIGSRDPTIALGEVRSQADYATGRKALELATVQGFTLDQFEQALKAGGVGPVAHDVLVQEFLQARATDRPGGYDPRLDPSSPMFTG